ncbi:hypothetical protein [Streptomyces sp. MN13]
MEKERLNSALEETVGLGLLDSTWQQWASSAAVEIAVPLPAVHRPRRGQITPLPGQRRGRPSREAPKQAAGFR